MKPRMLVLISTITLFTALTTPALLAAQERQQAEDAGSVDTSTANPTPLIDQPDRKSVV